MKYGFQDQEEGIRGNLSDIRSSLANLMKLTFFKGIEQKVLKTRGAFLPRNIKTMAINFETSSVEEARGIAIRSLVRTYFSLFDH